MDIIRITSESEAIDYLSSEINKVDIDQKTEIVFSGWPSLDLSITGAGYNSSLKTRQLRSLIKLQDTIYHQYGILVNKPKDKLSAEERNKLELNVSVGKGSTEVKIDLAETIANLASSSPYVVSVLGVVAVALIYGGVSVAKMYFASKNREADAENKKLDLIRELALRAPETRKLIEPAYNAIENLSYSASDADRITINGIENTQKKRKPLKSEKKRTSSYEKGNYYKKDCFVVGLKKPSGDNYKFEYILNDEAGNQLIWVEKKNEISSKLNHDISMAYQSKKKIYVEFDVEKKSGKNTFKIKVRSIFRKNNKPRSYK